MHPSPLGFTGIHLGIEASKRPNPLYEGLADSRAGPCGRHLGPIFPGRALRAPLGTISPDALARVFLRSAHSASPLGDLEAWRLRGKVAKKLR